MTFGEKLKSARKSKKMTQESLAKLIGAKHNSVSDWENDKSKPDMDTIELLCGALDEYYGAVTPQIRQAGNRLSGLTETACASLLA